MSATVLLLSTAIGVAIGVLVFVWLRMAALAVGLLLVAAMVGGPQTVAGIVEATGHAIGLGQ